MLPKDTPREEIPERLKLYEKCRYERANRIQEFTRLAGRDAAELQGKASVNSQCLIHIRQAILLNALQ